MPELVTEAERPSGLRLRPTPCRILLYAALMAGMGGAAGARATVHRWALSAFRRLPRSVRLRLVRTITPNYTIGALCLIEHEGRLLLLRQRHRHGWTLPGGLVDRGETAEQAVRREVLEETGLVVEVGAPIGVVVEPRTRWVDVLFHVPVDAPPLVHPASEAVRAAWLAPDRAGDIDDSTRRAFETFTRAGVDGARVGRLISPATPPA
jgi:8-oxo-dGTP diphosphatase